MKKVIAILLVLCMVCGLCACGANYKKPDAVGYVIIPHADGEEHAEFYSCKTCYGNLIVKCMDGRKIISANLIAIYYE
jgi:hypothetical protein